MKQFLSPLCLGLLALAFAFPSIGHGAAPKAPPTPTPKFTTVIKSISADSLTVTSGQKNSITYKVDKYAKFTLNGQNVKVDELKSGMRVNVTQGGTDGKTATEISATAAPKATPAPAAAAAPAKTPAKTPAKKTP